MRIKAHYQNNHFVAVTRSSKKNLMYALSFQTCFYYRKYMLMRVSVSVS